MKIYLSGAITGTNDYMERFKAAEEKLTQDGHTVFNPAAVNSMMPAEATYEEYMRVSFTLLDMCDAIYMMCGWQDSKGANREYGYALGKDMIIVEE